MNALLDVLMLLEQARTTISEQDELDDDAAVIHLELSMLIMDVTILIDKQKREGPQEPLFAIEERIKWN